ncbi:MAG: hypothetical protein ACR2KQ_11480 [Actinomycetota bacterium]
MPRTTGKGSSGSRKAGPRYHDIGQGFAVEWYPEVEIREMHDETLAHFLELTLSVEGGRLVCDRYTARRRRNGPPITADSIKQLPVVRAISEGGAPSIVRGRGRKPVVKADLDALPEVERAAVGYRIANFFGMAPTVYVAKLLDVSRDVAAKRVQAARRAGLLEPTTKGKKGG